MRKLLKQDILNLEGENDFYIIAKFNGSIVMEGHKTIITSIRTDEKYIKKYGKFHVLGIKGANWAEFAEQDIQSNSTLINDDGSDTYELEIYDII